MGAEQRERRVFEGLGLASGPFARLEAGSLRGQFVASTALMQGAQNLLEKATRRWRDDPPRALGYVEVALKLPFDDRERNVPAASAANFLLFTIMVDELEDSAEDDSSWLDAALQVLDQADETARFHIRDVLVDIDQDYELSTDEHRRLGAAVASIPPRAPLRLLTDLEQLPAEVASVVESCVAYREAREQLAEEETA